MFGDHDTRREGTGKPAEPGSVSGLAAWLDAPASPEMLTALMALDPARLSEVEAIHYLGLLDRAVAMLHFRQAQAMVSAAGSTARFTAFTTARGSVTVNLEDLAREEVASALRLSPGTAQIRIDRARLLTGQLARTGQALAAAEITYGHASAIADAADRLSASWSSDPESREAFTVACAALEDRVLPVARAGTVGKAKAAAERALLALDADAIKEQRRRQRATSGVQVFDDPGGMSTLWARLTTEMAHACMASISMCAESPLLAVPDGVDIGARRAIALTALLTGQLASTEVGPSSEIALAGEVAPSGEGAIPRPRLAVHLDVTISAASLLGLSEEPAEIVAAGSTVPVAVPACAIRELVALDGVDRLTWRRLVVDPMTGHLLDRGRETYQVGARMRDWIVARDRTCRFPGCSTRAVRCEIDHAEPWDAGGRTARGNLGALCKRHHLMKTHAGWSIGASAEDGSCTWRSPMGFRYEHDVEPLPGFAAAGDPPGGDPPGGATPGGHPPRGVPPDS